MYRVFVYGTLRAGEINARYMTRATHEQTASTPARFTLVDVGAYPAALDYGHTPLIGDIYRVDDATFADLDTLEGYPIFYSRRVVETSAGPAWIYLWAATCNRHWPVIQAGDWPTYRARRDLK